MQRRSFLKAFPAILALFKFDRSLASTKSLQSEGVQKGARDGDKVFLGPGREYLLPAAPKQGQKIHFVVSGNWAEAPPILKCNGCPIMGRLEDMTLDINSGFTLTYQNEKGWTFY